MAPACCAPGQARLPGCPSERNRVRPARQSQRPGIALAPRAAGVVGREFGHVLPEGLEPVQGLPAFLGCLHVARHDSSNRIFVPYLFQLADRVNHSSGADVFSVAERDGQHFFVYIDVEAARIAVQEQRAEAYETE